MGSTKYCQPLRTIPTIRQPTPAAPAIPRNLPVASLAHVRWNYCQYRHAKLITSGHYQTRTGYIVTISYRDVIHSVEEQQALGPPRKPTGHRLQYRLQPRHPLPLSVMLRCWAPRARHQQVDLRRQLRSRKTVRVQCDRRYGERRSQPRRFLWQIVLSAAHGGPAQLPVKSSLRQDRVSVEE
ncbi:unnamed protein product [Peniophora sp. CBMAI 1063]|nr:unnamed protein product [Peniophora sp. CBMAI 1063]